MILKKALYSESKVESAVSIVRNGISQGRAVIEQWLEGKLFILFYVSVIPANYLSINIKLHI